MYLKKSEVHSFSDIKDEMSQVFEHDFKKSVYKNEIIKRKHDGNFTDDDVAISRMLLDYRFSTAEQLKDAINEEGSLEKFEKRLDQLVRSRIINRFTLSYDKGIVNIPEDAFVAYCLDIGGHHLLTHFSEGEELLDWFYFSNIVTSELVARDLMIADISSKFIKNPPANMTYFRPKPELRVHNKTLVPAFEFVIEVGGRQNFFIGEVMRSNEPTVLFRDKAVKWGEFLNTNTWRKYYGGSDAMRPPRMIMLTTDEKTAFHAAKALTETAEIDTRDFFMTTERSTQQPLYESGSFMIYKPEDKVLAKVALPFFAPEDVQNKQ